MYISGGLGRLSTLAAGLYLLFFILVLAGVLLSAVFFARKIANSIHVDSRRPEGSATRTYTVHGQLFFVAVDKFIDSFDYREPVHHVVIDLRHASLWDSSGVAAIDKVVGKFRRNGMEVEVKSPSGMSGELHEKLAQHHKGVDLSASGGH